MTPADKIALAAVPPFRERLPWIGADLQTIRNLLMPNPPGPPGGGERLLLPVSDGDHLAARLDQPEGVGKRPLIVLVHGLTGSEASVNVRAAAGRFYAQGWSVLRVNLRGAGPSRPLSRGRYHAGRTEDLAAALHALPPSLLRRGVVLVGHSLGGNLILKFLGEGARDLPVLGGAAVSTPLDLAETCARMLAPRNFVYAICLRR